MATVNTKLSSVIKRLLNRSDQGRDHKNYLTKRYSHIIRTKQQTILHIIKWNTGIRLIFNILGHRYYIVLSAFNKF